jgi:hypothetical protein
VRHERGRGHCRLELGVDNQQFVKGFVIISN